MLQGTVIVLAIIGAAFIGWVIFCVGRVFVIGMLIQNNLLNEIRIEIGATLLSWALTVLPLPHKTDLARALHPVFEKWIRK